MIGNRRPKYSYSFTSNFRFNIVHEVRTVVNNEENTPSSFRCLTTFSWVMHKNTFIAHIFGVFFVRLCIDFLKLTLPLQINNISRFIRQRLYRNSQPNGRSVGAILIPNGFQQLSCNRVKCKRLVTFLKKWLPNYTVSDIKILLNNWTYVVWPLSRVPLFQLARWSDFSVVLFYSGR